MSIEKKRTSWAEFQAKLNSTEKAVLKGLQEKTGYDITSSPTPLIFVEEKIKHLQKIKELSIQKARLAQNILDEVFVQIRNELFMIYPIFNNSYGANHGDLLSAQFKIVQNAKQAMLTHPEFSHYQDLFLKRDEANDEVDSWERLKVRWERIQYLLETKLLEDLLAASPLDTVKQKYQSLQDCEAASFF